ILLAIQTGNKLTDDDRLSFKDEDFSLTSPEEMEKKFAHIPGAVENTAKIAEMCNFEMELGTPLLPNFPKPDGKTANAYLRELIEERLPSRYPGDKLTPAVRERVEYEFGVIEKTGYADYFLIVQDLINWAKNHGISVGPGRGSAAGSIVAYILKITDIDPLQYDLLFERFLNPERIQMPDIDIDFADIRRDEVLAYARQKYGEDHVAQIITFGTMAARAAIRDAGRTMGVPYSFCDQVAKLIPFNPTQGMKEGWLKKCLEEVEDLKIFYNSNPQAKELIDTAMHLEGVVRHASVHACGTVISRDPLDERVPLQFAPQDKEIIITQIEMHGIEDLGLLKIDFLGLKNLTIIEDTLRLVRELQNKDIKIEEIPLDDPKTFELLQRGDTTGVFQFESSGMRRYMKDIGPTELEDLIALVALYRPGPMELIPSFIKRKHGEEKITYLHPKLEPILKNTYGIGVYQ
ncbi:MAG: DNA polymerase III subunit alpha, partial [Sedimentisphaerales bacterium]|nr:DNA polymerase III subunit alpha [Sedimentisphaerales bacterium]